MSAPGAEAASGPPTVLVIFESSAVRETVSLLDFGEGFEVVTADGGEAGLAAVSDSEPDIVVVSAVAGQDRARELVKAVKELVGDNYLPVVVVSVRFDPAERELAYRAGADDCMELTAGDEDAPWRLKALARSGRAFRMARARVRDTEERAFSLARANAEAGKLILDVEERDRRIQEQQKELAERARRLAQANAEAGRLILEVEEKDRRLESQAAEIEKHLAALRRDLALAADLQINLLPVEHPSVREVQLFDRFLPAAELCGDYFDYVLHPNGDFDVVVADVTGHGVASALVSVQVRAVTRSHSRFERSPAAVLSHLNDFVVSTFNRQFFMTMFYIGYRSAGLDSPRLIYAGAGHTPPILVGDGRTVEIRSQGLPLGVEVGAEFAENELEMAPGERLLVYTDGLVEIYDAQRRQWGPEGLRESLIGASKLAGREVIDRLLRDARYFGGQRPFDDDVTVVLLERAAEG
ncbi:MAG: PP2C family protein-serine/threonine phosphatase [Planctomycetota bacterium]